MLKKCDREQLIIRYKITEFENALDFLNLVAKRCGKVKKSGIPDINKAAHMVLNDWTRYFILIFIRHGMRIFIKRITKVEN